MTKKEIAESMKRVEELRRKPKEKRKVLTFEIGEEIVNYIWERARTLLNDDKDLETVFKTDPLIRGLRSFTVAANAARRLPMEDRRGVEPL